jgi:hypothetical protein
LDAAVRDLVQVQERGTDPLQRAERIADEAIPGRAAKRIAAATAQEGGGGGGGPSSRLRIRSKPGLRQRRTKLDFADSDEEENDRHFTRLGLSNLSSSPKRRQDGGASSSRHRSGEDSSPYRSGIRKRRAFTEEEKDVIRGGVETFGIGHWAEIKAHYFVILRHRTSVQIKDCYRTMVKKNEV